ncbi:TetR/AcrR family transcriptional regulator [Aeromicrobium sp.]|uniref:TetR/AcrR family transcriptional regulator n=1 Tax=Aeromicrobium sp. TaxID=1871063 RepID=UPI0039E677B2
MSAEERRIAVLEAAIEEYGRAGMHATSTEAIAARAGISQPYLFRLFGTKTDLITAAIEHHTAVLRDGFREAAENRPDGVSPLQAMATAYLEFLAGDANDLRCQLHTWAAASDPAIKDVAQRTYRQIWADVAELSGADPAQLRSFMADGMLLTVLGALDLLDLFGDPADVIKEY